MARGTVRRFWSSIMKPAPFSYHAPSTLDECLDLLSEFGDDAAVLAGGQSLNSLMRFRLAQPAHVVSIGKIGEPLSSIRMTDEGVSIGARMTYSAIQRSPDVKAACPGLPVAIDLIATPPVRTRGTACGNLSHADPASELPAVALLLDARFRLRSHKGERVLPAEEFFRGPYMTARRPDELLVEVIFPRRPTGETFVIKEVTRIRGGFPLAGVAIVFSKADGTKLNAVRIGCFGVNSRQIRVKDAEAILEAQGFSDDALAAACEAIDGAIEPYADPFASVEYRRSATRTLFMRAMSEGWHQESAQK